MSTSNNIVKTISISALRANILTLLIFLPFYFVMRYLFIAVWGYTPYAEGMATIRANVPIFVLVFVLGIVLHEGLHGLMWAIFAPNGLKSIKFGIKWLYLTPYCHCNQPMKRNHYLLGGAMPGLLMGVIPLIIGFATANSWLTVLGVIFTGAAGGDFILIVRLLKIDRECTIEDHPNEIGFIVRK